jgi:hypothetical protein
MECGCVEALKWRRACNRQALQRLHGETARAVLNSSWSKAHLPFRKTFVAYGGLLDANSRFLSSRRSGGRIEKTSS